MPFLYIENFEAGLDTRRAAFTAPAGSLRVLRNAHITRGREIERRQAFAPFAELPAGTFGLCSPRGELTTFGSGPEPTGMPATVRYQRLESPEEANMTRLWATEIFSGRVYAVAEYDDGRLYHFYDGEVVTDWTTLAGDIASVESVVAALALRMERSDYVDPFSTGSRLVLTGTSGEEIDISSPTTDVTVTELQGAVPAQGEVRATATFSIIAGSPGQTFNTIAALRVDDTDLIGGPVDFVDDNTATAQAVADRINAFTSGYQSTADGNMVEIIAPPGLGAMANGRALTIVTAGDVEVMADSELTDGADPVSAVPQITEVHIGSYDADRVYEVDIEDEAYLIRGSSSAVPTAVRAVKQKMYAVTGPLLYFSGLAGDPPQPDPTRWQNQSSGPTVIGAGFIDTGSQYSGSDNLIGLGVYQNRVVAFGRNSTQIWNVDPDPAQNAIYQVLLNVGTTAPESVVEYGDLDIFFLSDSGVRSLRARDSSNLASANDVGVSIDAELTAYMKTLPRQDVLTAHAVVEPANNRYLLAVGQRIYVFSNFPGSRVAAWSTYDLPEVVQAWAVAEGRLYARTGDTVRLYGGLSGDQYDDSETEVVLPFLDAGSPAGHKRVVALDVGASGRWRVDLATEPNFADEWETCHTITETTYGSAQTLSMQGKTTHFALRFITSRPEPALIGNAVIEFDDIG